MAENDIPYSKSHGNVLFSLGGRLSNVYSLWKSIWDIILAVLLLTLTGTKHSSPIDILIRKAVIASKPLNL